MADYSDLFVATRAVVDPATSAADLATIAQAQPTLRPQVAAHQNVYPGLLQWLKTQSADAAPAASQASRPALTQMPAARQSRDIAPKTWGLIGGLVLVVVVAIVLLVVHPWKATTAGGTPGPALSVDQFANMLQVQSMDDLNTDLQPGDFDGMFPCDDSHIPKAMTSVVAITYTGTNSGVVLPPG